MGISLSLPLQQLGAAIERLFETPDAEFGMFSVLFDPRGMEMDRPALLKVVLKDRQVARLAKGEKERKEEGKKGVGAGVEVKNVKSSSSGGGGGEDTEYFKSLLQSQGQSGPRGQVQVGSMTPMSSTDAHTPEKGLASGPDPGGAGESRNGADFPADGKGAVSDTPHGNREEARKEAAREWGPSVDASPATLELAKPLSQMPNSKRPCQSTPPDPDAARNGALQDKSNVPEKDVAVQPVQKHLKNLPIYVAVTRKQAMVLREVRGGDALRLYILTNKMGVKLIGRRGLGQVGEELVYFIMQVRGERGG